MSLHILKAANLRAGLVVLAAAPAWLDKSGQVTIGRRPGDPPAPHLDADALRAAGESLSAVLRHVECVLRAIAPAAGAASSMTHLLHIADPLYAGERTWLVQLESLPTDEGAAEHAGYELAEGSLTLDALPPDGPVQ